jgi:hypothetical protein
MTKEKIGELYEETDMTLQAIADELGFSFKQVFSYVAKYYTKEIRAERKKKSYSLSKLGDKNPMLGKTKEQHPTYLGVVGDSKGYLMVLKPDWYTGRKGSRHIFQHHAVVCENLGLTAIPKGWVVHHVDRNPHNNDFSNLVLCTMSDHTRLHQRLEGATTISKESTLKWVEAHGTQFMRNDIVCSA